MKQNYRLVWVGPGRGILKFHECVDQRPESRGLENGLPANFVSTDFMSNVVKVLETDV